MRTRATIALAALAMLTACDAGTAALPAPPAALQPLERIPWGDALLSRTGALARHVDGQMRDRFGAAKETAHAARVGSIPTIQSYYRDRLGTDWKPLPLRFVPGEGGFGFARGEQAIVVGWIDQLEDGQIPVTVFRYGAE